MSKSENVPCADRKEVTEHFIKVYEETFAGLKRFVMTRCADLTALSDILQDIYVTYYELLLKKGLSYIENDTAMLRKVAERRLFRYYSLKQKLSVLVPLFRRNDAGEEYCVSDAPEYSLTGEVPGTEKTVITAMESEEIFSKVCLFPEKTKKILMLYYVERMPQAKIAELFHMSLSNVKNTIYRSIQKLREGEGE